MKKLFLVLQQQPSLSEAVNGEDRERLDEGPNEGKCGTKWKTCWNFLGQALIPGRWFYVKQENGSSNYQRTLWGCFLHAGWHFDLRGNNESNQKLSYWAHNPFVTCLPSALKTSCFCLAFRPLSDSVTIIKKKKKPVNHVWKVILAETPHVSVVSVVNCVKLWLNRTADRVKTYSVHFQPVIKLL